MLAAPWSVAQEAVGGDDASRAFAVAESSFRVDVFGGGDEDGGFWGGAPSVTVPLGESLGLQIDGIAGSAADSITFYGGAAQLFYRDPQNFLVGVAALGLVADDESQFSISAIAEYYVDNVTLEAMAGGQFGDISDGTAFGRVGLAVYGGENLRLAGGVSYSEEAKLGADVELEYRLFPEAGLSVFASGAFDQDGELGLAGLRLYLNGMAGQTESGVPSLMEIDRHLGRRNLFLAAPTVTGTRFIAQAAGALSNGGGFGEIAPAPVASNGLSGNALAASAGGTPLSGLTDALTGVLNGLVPTTDTGTALDEVPLVGDVAGAVMNLLSPDTVRVNDLPVQDGAIANIPLIGDVIGLLPAQGLPALLGSLQTEAVLTQLAPGLVQGLLDPANLAEIGTNLLTGTLGNLVGGLTGEVPLPSPLSL
ncbi:MAG: hypothetical protein PHS60_00885 [Zavarzinia sp.]|nr:hypothetical protein [Zavarzinia sp.]